MRRLWPFVAMVAGAAIPVTAVALLAAGLVPIGPGLAVGALPVWGYPAIWIVRSRRERDPEWLGGAWTAAGIAAVMSIGFDATLGTGTALAATVGVAASSAAAWATAALYLRGHRAWHRSGWWLPFGSRVQVPAGTSVDSGEDGGRTWSATKRTGSTGRPSR